MLKIESEYDMKKGCSRTTLSFWNNHRFLVRLNDPDLTGDDAYLIISRYLAYIGKHPSLAAYQNYWRIRDMERYPLFDIWITRQSSWMQNMMSKADGHVW